MIAREHARFLRAQRRAAPRRVQIYSIRDSIRTFEDFAAITTRTFTVSRGIEMHDKLRYARIIEKFCRGSLESKKSDTDRPISDVRRR